MFNQHLARFRSNCKFFYFMHAPKLNDFANFASFDILLSCEMDNNHGKTCRHLVYTLHPNTCIVVFVWEQVRVSTS
jgi:hypothetical protein